MSRPLRLALCPGCENWQPVLDAESQEVTHRCVHEIEGAPKMTLCNRFVQAPGRGGIQEWVDPPEGNEA
jgi:hypothetical protein